MEVDIVFTKSLERNMHYIRGISGAGKDRIEGMGESVYYMGWYPIILAAAHGHFQNLTLQEVPPESLDNPDFTI